MTTFDSVTDSGERRDFGTGSVRDQSEGKGRYDLLEPYAIKRLAQHFENGAKKYGDNNWKLGQPLSVYLDSGIRHGFNLLEGQTNEDHAAAMAWNAMAFISTKHWIDEGKLPKALDDIDWDVVPEEVTEISSWDNILKTHTIKIDIPSVNPELLNLYFGGDAPIVMAGPVDDEPEEPTFEVGDRVRHNLGFNGTVAGVWEEVEGGIVVDWDKAPAALSVGGHRVPTFSKNVTLLERAPEPGTRVSVRKIAKALKPVKFVPAEQLFSRYREPVNDLTLEDSEIVQILDALEDAGYEVTYAPKG